MTTMLHRQLDVTLRRGTVVARRDFLRTAALGGTAAGMLGWTDVVRAKADELRRQGKACIVLWLQGGPSQLETFDPKPGHPNGGETQAIKTTVPGLEFADNLPKLAEQAHRLAVIRSLSTKEGNHQRASYLMHTAYVPTASLHHPAMGAVVASELRDAACQLPAFVRIGQRFISSSNGGFLGTEFDAFAVASANRTPDNVVPGTDRSRYERRLALLERMETTPGSPLPARPIEDHRKLYDQASRMILSPQMQAFDLSRESAAARAGYGSGEFGSGCLLARRLVEDGVPFVEVGLGNWDTHDDNFNRVRQLSGQLDQPLAYLIEDLAQRGLLERTLVLCLGEFGRTPRINPRGGRDHFPRAFSAVAAGCGVRGGAVIGRTTEGGDDVADRPITEKDLFRTVYSALGIDADKEHMSPIGRPIKLVDGGEVVQELFA